MAVWAGHSGGPISTAKRPRWHALTSPLPPPSASAPPPPPPTAAQYPPLALPLVGPSEGEAPTAPAQAGPPPAHATSVSVSNPPGGTATVGGSGDGPPCTPTPTATPCPRNTHLGCDTGVQVHEARWPRLAQGVVVLESGPGLHSLHARGPLQCPSGIDPTPAPTSAHAPVPPAEQSGIHPPRTSPVPGQQVEAWPVASPSLPLLEGRCSGESGTPWLQLPHGLPPTVASPLTVRGATPHTRPRTRPRTRTRTRTWTPADSPGAGPTAPVSPHVQCQRLTDLVRPGAGGWPSPQAPEPRPPAPSPVPARCGSPARDLPPPPVALCGPDGKLSSRPSLGTGHRVVSSSPGGLVPARLPSASQREGAAGTARDPATSGRAPTSGHLTAGRSWRGTVPG
jgi:hypothetical protein